MSYQQQERLRWHYAEFDDSNFQVRGRTLFFMVILFCVILLIGVVFLYARWVCRFGSPELIAPPPLPSTSGLDQAAINSFPIALHRSSSADGGVESECCICLGMFVDGEKVKALPQCRHCFHSECVDEWLATQSSCPLCRASLLVDSIV